jgi:hypothetical protein
MKTLQKYANMAFLLLSVATTMSMDKNITDKQQVKTTQKELSVELNRVQIPWYNKQVRIGNTTTTIGTITGNVAIYAGFIALLAYSCYHEKKLGIPLLYRG